MNIVRTPCRAAPLLLGLLLAACGSSGALRTANVPEREVGAFVVRLGADTVAVEEFWRTATQLEGRQVLRTPRTSVRDYSATLGPDGALTRLQVRFRDAPAAPPTLEATVEFAADTALVRLARGGNVQEVRVAAPAGSIPFLGYSVALYELPLARMRASGADAMSAAMVPIGGTAPMVLSLRAQGTDTVMITNIAGESRARVDGSGRILWWDGTGSTLAITAERTFGLDLDRMASDFAARDVGGRGLGSLSPRDSVQTALGEATLTVTYGRPAARGRRIFGEVVPFDQVWRTGANQATQLRTTRDLVIGETPVPAGTYTLFSIPSATGWQLIVNRQTDQWGTQHDPAQDVARIPMRRETLPMPVEQFTIAVVPDEAGRGTLHLSWDDTRVSVQLRVR
jgi:hypothetical protein